MNRRALVWITLSAGLALNVTAAAPLAAQGTASVSGRVIDSTSALSIVGARVGVVGTTTATLTDREGRYLLRGLPAGTVVVRAQRIGFAPQSRAVTLIEGGTGTQDFALSAAATVLSEVVVTGYGTMSRENISGAVSSVQASEIRNTPLAGLDAAMQGRAAGVQVTQNAGNPGAGITVRIRGAASIGASNQPLYVIDGVPLLRDNFSQLGVGGQDITAVTGINPDEIESIDILKDASSAAIYGSRGSNGVVMITTKRGRAGRSQLNFTSYTGVQDIPKGSRWDLMNAKEYITYMNAAAENDGYGALYFGDPADPALRSTDWQAEVFRTAPVRNLGLNVSGGNDRTRYFISGSHFDQVGVVIGSAYNRQSGRVNLDFTATDRLTFRSSLNFNRESHDRIENDNSIAGVVTNAIAEPPWIPARRADNSFTTPDDGLPYVNPIAVGTYDFANSRGLRALGSLEAVYALGRGVTLNGRFGMDVVNLRDLRWFSPRVGGSYSESVGGYSIIGNQTVTRYLVEEYATVDRTLGSSGKFSWTGGGSVEWNGQELDYLEGVDFAHDQFQYPGNASTVTAYNGDWFGHNLVSFFSRLTASFNDRYLVNASIRTDGSSRFGAHNRYGTFPAVSVGWKLTEEPFARGLMRFGDLKLRASYGATGNQEINDDFAPLGRFARANYTGSAGLRQRSFANPDLKWEKTHEYDLGMDLGLWGGRVTVLADWYRKTTTNLLLERAITSTSGQTTVLENVGSMTNNGFELAIGAMPVAQRSPGGLQWNVDFNIAWNSNLVTKLFRNQPLSVGLYDLSRLDVGHPLAAFYAIKYIGVDPATGDAIYQDQNTVDTNADGIPDAPDGVINDDDRVYIGSPQPKFWGGLTNTLTWGGFDLRTFFQFTQGHLIYNAISVFAHDGGYYYDNKFRRALSSWKQPGDITNEPRPSFDGTSGADRISSRYFEDGSYVRLQEVTLGYKLPASIGAALHMPDARVWLSGRNLHTWTAFTGYSPDVNSNGSGSNTALSTEFYAYPPARTFMVGISGTF